LYLDHGAEIFPPKKIGVLKYLFRSRDERSLHRLIVAITDKALVCDSIVRFCVPSAEGKAGDIYVWKTPHHPDYVLDWNQPLFAVARATTAAPTFFKEFLFGMYEHLDGGLYANNPSMLGVVEAISAFDVSPTQIRLLSVGCGNFGAPQLTTWKRNLGGLLSWYDVYRWFSHFQAAHVEGLVSLTLGAQNQIRVDPIISGDEIALDDYGRASTELPIIADRIAEEKGREIADLFFTQPAEPYSPFYNLDHRPHEREKASKRSPD
jgi:hypothetical protein